MGITLGVAGSREYIPKSLVFETLDKYKIDYDVEKIVTGDAYGVDKYAREWAYNSNIDYEEISPIPPQQKNDKLRYLFRNIEIITKSDLLITFWNGKNSSRGTRFVINYSFARNKLLKIIIPDLKDLR